MDPFPKFADTAGSMRVGLHRKGSVKAAVCGIAAMAVLLPVPTSASASAALPAPAHLRVARVASDPTDLAVTWSAVSGIDHYAVTVFDGSTDDVTIVAKDTTSLVYTGSGNCTRYRVVVAAVYPDGGIGRTGTYWVPALAPGAVSQLAWNGKGDESPSQLSWAPPTIRSEKPAADYSVKVSSLSTGKEIVATTTSGMSVDVPGLDSNRLYKAKVQAMNAFGTCATATLMIRGAKTTMTPPRKPSIVRDPSVPNKVSVSWLEPDWTGSASVSGYEVAHSSGGKVAWQLVSGARNTEVQLDLDPTKDWDVQIRAVGSGKATPLTKPVTLYRLGASGKPETDPAVAISQSGAKVIVVIDGPVGSSSRYPKGAVRIAPTLDGKGFRDQHLISNHASRVVFGDVPCGVYTVVVTGQGPTAAKEFGRTVLERCQEHVLTAADWRLVGGRAEITGNKVFINYGSRVLSTLPHQSQDLVFTTEVDLQQGNGYGVWARSSWDGGHVTTGYSFQYDLGVGNKFIIRLWSADKECGTALAATNFPSGMSRFGKHKLVLVVQGDSLYATIDGVRLYDVPSLTKAITSSKCSMPVPNGTQIALRTWTTDTLVTFTGTALS